MLESLAQAGYDHLRPGVMLVLVLLGLVAQLSAQRWHVRSYTAADGLPGHHIEDLAQLSSGSMAFLTLRGLGRYDGAYWETDEELPTGSAQPWRLVAGVSEELWAHVDSELWRWSRGSWELITTTPRPSSDCCGLLYMDQQGSERIVIVAREGVLFVFSEGRWETLRPGQLEGSFLTAVEHGQHCLVGSDRGVLEFDLEQGTSREWELELPPGGVRSMDYDERTDVLWLVGSGWVGSVSDVSLGGRELVLSRSDQVLLRGDTPDASNLVPLDTRWASKGGVVCAADLAGGLYFGDRLKVYYFNPSTGFQELGVKNGLSTGGITSAMLDREGNMWLCGPRGANKVVSRRLQSYDRDQGLFDDEVSAAMQRSDGTIVLGHGGGLTFMRPPLLQSEPELMPLSTDVVVDRVMDLAEDSSEQLWVAGGHLGLGCMQRDGSLEFVQRESGESVVSVEVMANGLGVWVATDFGLYRFVEGQWESVQLIEGLDHLQIRKLETDSDGGLLIATARHGVLAYSDGVTRQWTSTDPGLYSTYTLLRDSRGVLWVGTPSGLALANDDGELVHSTEPQLMRPVFALTEDHDEQLWIGSDLGFTRWDGTSMREFTTTDGLLGQEANRSAAMVDESGLVWLGTDAGISAYHAYFDQPHLFGPTVELGLIKAGERAIPLMEGVTLGHESRTLSFEFQAISFIDEDNVRIQARLEGWDDDWSTAKPELDRSVQYTNLPAGEYRLHLRAIDVEGEVSPEVVSATVKIKAALWERWWFIASASVLILLLTSGSVGLILQRRYTVRLEHEVEVRAERLREMEQLLRAESLGLLAGGIAHDFNNLLTAIIGSISILQAESDASSETGALLRDADAACWKAHSLATQLLTFSRGGTPIKEAAAVSEVVTECARFSLRGSSVNAVFDIPSDIHPVEVDTGQFSQVLNNIVINARQAMADGGTLHVKARNTLNADRSKGIVVEFADEGPGMSADTLERIFDPYFSTRGEGRGLGLATAYMIIQRHGGELTARSVLGEGAVFRITLPASAVPCVKPGEMLRQEAMPKTTVLVMDDEKPVRDIVCMALERVGCVVLEAEEGAAAVKLYQEAGSSESPVDVVIMDLTVPGGMGGLDATAAILDIDPDARIIVSSGYAETDAISEYASYGFVERLVKPYRVEQLLSVIAASVRSQA